MSTIATLMDEAVRQPFNEMRQSALGNRETFDELCEVWRETRESNWDGYDALPVEQATIRNAYCVLEALPIGCPAPTIGAEPSGALTLEWYQTARRILSVSVSGDGDLYYAALFGTNRVHGKEDFTDRIPKIILNLIERVYGA